MSSFEEYFYYNISNKIRQYRIIFGYTQEQLSELLGKNLKYIGHIERQERKISQDALLQLMQIFKVQPTDFYNFDEKYIWK